MHVMRDSKHSMGAAQGSGVDRRLRDATKLSKALSPTQEESMTENLWLKC